MAIETKQQMDKRHQDEFGALPILWAFSNEQFHEGIEKLKAEGSLADGEKVVRIGGGGYIAKHALPELEVMLKRHENERKGIVSEYESAKAAFIYEMNNHEYFINMQADWDVINCFTSVEYKDEGTEGYLARTDWGEDTKRAYRDAKRECFKQWEEIGW